MHFCNLGGIGCNAATPLLSGNIFAIIAIIRQPTKAKMTYVFALETNLAGVLGLL
ncbi:MAG: hypothetical protein FWG63_08740 [Defluviitaleaceae bacterium]|nr:hypothetical protein [Defluviitaleaceae bacterium]